MTPKEAADKLRPTFQLEQMPSEDRHAVKFIEAVADELGVEKTAFNLHQVGSALDAQGVEHDTHEFPKMLYSRTHHAEDIQTPSVYDKRHDAVWVNVLSQEEADKLGGGWVDSLDKLPPRGELPIHAEAKPAATAEPDLVTGE